MPLISVVKIHQQARALTDISKRGTPSEAHRSCFYNARNSRKSMKGETLRSWHTDFQTDKTLCLHRIKVLFYLLKD